MKIILERERPILGGIPGTLKIVYRDTNILTLHTLENEEKKINPGTYRMICTHSPKFNKFLWNINCDRLGIRIHAGNYINDFQGCIGVGLLNDTDHDPKIWKSQRALNTLHSLLDRDNIYSITIKNKYND